MSKMTAFDERFLRQMKIKQDDVALLSPEEVAQAKAAVHQWNEGLATIPEAGSAAWNKTAALGWCLEAQRFQKEAKRWKCIAIVALLVGAAVIGALVGWTNLWNPTL